MTKKIVIDPGHGVNGDPGAVGYIKERTGNLKVAAYMEEYLKDNYNCSIKTTTANQTINDRAAMANKWDADLFVSIHFNAGGGDGYEALVYSRAEKALGQLFEKYVKAIGQNSRGVKYRPDLGVLRLTKMKAILNECAFVDNKKDIHDWNEPAEFKKMGIAFAKATAAYLDIPVKSAETKFTNKTTTNKTTKTNFKVKVLVNALNIRKGAGTKHSVVGVIKNKGVYTIVAQSGNWGKLKSGAGWINIGSSYCKKM